MTHEIEIRELQPEDYADVLAIEGPDGWTLDEFRAAEIRHHARTVAVVADDLVVSFMTLAAEGSVLTVLNLGTRPEYRRHGFAARLMQTAVDAIHMADSGVTALKLICHAENYETRGLMRACGLHQIHSPMLDYYPDGEAGILFCLTRCARRR